MRYLHQLPALILAILLTRATAGDERTILTVDETLDENVKSMEIEIEFGFGEIRLERGNPAKAVTGYMQYDEDSIRPSAKYKVEGDRAYFRLVTKSRHRGWSLDYSFDSPESEIYFTTRVPLDIDFSCGLGEASLDLGKMKVRELSLANGLGETTLNFSTPNGVELRRLSVDNGLGELTALNLSNARSEKLSFDCGLGEATLDFRGESRHDMEVDINVGLGSVTLKIPRGYNVELDAEENFLSSINARGLERLSRSRYRSSDYDPKKPTITIDASVGLGSIDIKWTD